MRSRSMMAVMVVLACTATAATAQHMMPAPGPGGEVNASRRVEEIRIGRMTEALKLDEKTAAKFIPAVTALDSQRRTLMSERRQHLFELRKQLEAQHPDEGKLAAILEKLRKNERDQMATRDKEYESAKAHLTVEQQARYVIFQREFNREVRGIIDDMRGGHGPGKGPGRGPGGGPGMGGGRPGGPPGPAGPEQK